MPALTARRRLRFCPNRISALTPLTPFHSTTIPPSPSHAYAHTRTHTHTHAHTRTHTHTHTHLKRLNPLKTPQIPPQGALAQVRAAAARRSQPHAARVPDAKGHVRGQHAHKPAGQGQGQARRRAPHRLEAKGRPQHLWHEEQEGDARPRHAAAAALPRAARARDGARPRPAAACQGRGGGGGGGGRGRCHCRQGRRRR